MKRKRFIVKQIAYPIAQPESGKAVTEICRQMLHLKYRGLSGVKLFITDKCLGLVEARDDGRAARPRARGDRRA